MSDRILKAITDFRLDASRNGFSVDDNSIARCAANAAILSLADAVALNTIISSASQCAKVAKVDDTMPDGILYGTARHIVKSETDFSFITESDDVRDAFLRVTLNSGFEAFWSVASLIPLIRKGEFAIYDW